jgi:hypothetical protein
LAALLFPPTISCCLGHLRLGNYSFVSLGDSSGDLFGGSLGTLEQRQINAVDGTSWVFGAHQLKFGVDYRELLPLVRAAGDQYFQFNGVTGLVDRFTAPLLHAHGRK